MIAANAPPMVSSGRISVAAGCLGVIEDCLEEVINYTKERHQHGKPIAKHQLIQDHIAAIEIHRVTTDAIVMKAAEAKDESVAHPDDRNRARKADILAAQAKYFASNAAWDAADRAVQAFGGRGYMRTNTAERFLRELRVDRIWEGTSEIQRLIVARGLERRGVETLLDVTG